MIFPQLIIFNVQYNHTRYSSYIKERRKDLAFNKIVYQSTTAVGESLYERKPELGIEGGRLTCSATLATVEPSWWALDLGAKYFVETVMVDAFVFQSKCFLF